MKNKNNFSILLISIAFLLSQMISCVRYHFNIPPDTTIEYKESSDFTKPLGYCNPKKKKIIICNPIGDKKIIGPETTRLITNHELGHLYGIKECKHKYCIMYESKSRLIELLVKPIQFCYGFRFCPECKAYLDSKGAFKKE